MIGSGDRLDDSEGVPFDGVSGVRRWGPRLVVMIALAVVLITVAATVYLGKVTQIHFRSGLTPPPATSHHLAGQPCIALDLAAVGAPATKVAGAYRLRVLVGDNGSACVLEPSAVRLLAESRGGEQRTFATPATAVRAGPLLVVDYEVVFPPTCTPGSGSDSVLLSVGGALLAVSRASIPGGLAACHAVTVMVSAYR